MKLSVLVVSFLLLVSAFTFLPAVGAFSPTTVAKTGSAPSTITGATASIDNAILAGYGIGVTRTISLNNPIGNAAITTFTISIPKGAVGSGNPTATVYAGSPGATAAVFGTGPWAVVYSGASPSGVLVPGGATVKVTVSFHTETTFAATSGVADPYSLSTSVTDTTGATTTLAQITVYETASTTATVTGPSGSLTAGTPFTVTVKGTDSGLPLLVTDAANVSFTSGTNDVSTTTTLSPSSFVTGSGTQSITVNDTTAEKLYVAVFGGAIVAPSINGTILGNSSALIIYPGAISGLAIKVLGVSSSHILNISTTQGLHPIAPASISVSTADKYGNPVVSGGTTNVVLTADTFSGQPAGFSSASAYGLSYPYAPSPVVNTSVTLTIPNGQSTVSPTTAYYFFGVDYGSQSQLVATSSSGLATGLSSMIKTYALSAQAVTLFPASNVNVEAGSSQNVNATLAVAQKNVPIAFGFSGSSTYPGSYSSTGTNATTVFTAIVGTSAVATATVVVATTLNAKVYINATETLNSTTSATPVIATGALVTTAGSLAKLTVQAFFGTAAFSLTGQSTSVVAKGTLYLNITATDAYGNAKTVTGDTQLTVTASAGALSTTVPVILLGTSSTYNSGDAVQFVAPSTVGTVVTISASGVSSGVSLSGSTTVTVVSATPLLSVTGPSSWTSGIPSPISGTANASTGIASNKITTITYSVNGGTAQAIAFSSAANVAFSFSVLLTGTSNINVTITDSAGNTNWAIVQVPPLAPALTFTSAGTGLPAQYQFPNGGPEAVATTFTNNGATSLTIVVIANVFTSGGIPLTPSPTATATVAAGASATVYNLLSGFPHGTYTVTVNVYSTAYVSLSPTYTVTVTV